VTVATRRSPGNRRNAQARGLCDERDGHRVPLTAG
jgi:hypothetical protein